MDYLPFSDGVNENRESGRTNLIDVKKGTNVSLFNGYKMIA